MPNKRYTKRTPLQKIPYRKRVEPMPEYHVKESTPLLEYLLQKCTHLSRNNIKSLLTHRQILVNGVPITQYDFLLAKEDVVQISHAPIKKVKEKEKLKILYEDDELIAIHKPSGLLSVASDKEKEMTAYRQLMDYVRLKDPKGRIYVVHRIDKDTSGVLIVAKTEKIRDALQKRWNDLVKDRGYYAIIEGQLKEKEGTIHSFLRKATTNLMYSSKNPKDGKSSITHYKVLKETPQYSLLDVHIDTGRKNQIRVHMRDLGHPIIGDAMYGDSKVDPIHRLGLHAYCLEFRHPIKKKWMKFVDEMPEEFHHLFADSKKK